MSKQYSRTHQGTNEKLPPTTFDLVVVGGGIAGCAIAWEAIRRQRSIAMIDSPNPNSSSRVAAGLVTPITGNRLANSWEFDSLFPHADNLYQFAQSLSGQNFWTKKPALRIFITPEESERFHSKWTSTPHGTIQATHHNPDQFADLHAPWGGFSMQPAARLNTQCYLQATHDYLKNHQALFLQHLNLPTDLQPSPSGFCIPALKLEAKYACLALGTGALAHNWFPPLDLHPARGDILKIIPPPNSYLATTDSVIHKDAWFVPLANGTALLGATYDRHATDTDPASPCGIQAKEQLIERFATWFPQTARSLYNPPEIIEQRAAVRPASYDRHPLIGPHPNHPNLICLNGLGSKGSLLAPKLAISLWDWLESQSPIPKSLLWNRRYSKL
jgi:glycine/D-amino acid oxidase-like deaminating enzyme